MLYGGEPKDLPDRNFNSPDDKYFLIFLFAFMIIAIIISFYRTRKNEKDDQ